MRSKEIAAHDLSTIGLEAPMSSQCSPSAGRSPRSCTPSPSHHYDPAGRTLATWDLIDLQLLQALTGENLAPVKDACQRIFAARGQQPWPPYITTYLDWSDRYTTMASSLDMPITDLNQAVEVVHALIHAIDTS